MSIEVCAHINRRTFAHACRRVPDSTSCVQISTISQNPPSIIATSFLTFLYFTDQLKQSERALSLKLATVGYVARPTQTPALHVHFFFFTERRCSLMMKCFYDSWNDSNDYLFIFDFVWAWLIVWMPTQQLWWYFPVFSFFCMLFVRKHTFYWFNHP